VFKALESGAFPKSFKPGEIDDFEQAKKAAKESLFEITWEWDHLLNLTSTGIDYLKLEKIPVIDFAHIYIANIYRS